MKKLLLGVISVMAACSVYGQAVSYRNFNANQLGSNNFILSIKSNSLLTNSILKAPRFTGINGTDSVLAQVLAGSSGTVLKFTDPNNILWPAVFLSDTGLVAGPIFGATFNGSGSGLTSIPPTTGIAGWPADAAGVLENDGAGNYSWGAGGGGGGGVSITRGNSIQVHTNGSLLTLNISGNTNRWNPLNYGTTGVYPNDATLAMQRAATNLDFAGGTLWLPNMTITTTNTVVLGSGKQVFMPHAQFDYGNYDVVGDGLSRFYPLHNTNVLFFANNLRRVKLDNINIHGQNTTQSNNTTYIGVAAVGPSGGNAEWKRLNVQDMGVGVVLNDMTGLVVDKGTFAYNFIGAATAYKPDAVAFRDTLFVRNMYGAFLMWSNAQFTQLSGTEGYVTFDNCDFGQNTFAAAVVPRGHAVFKNCYFESNGTNGEPYMAVQAGMNPTNVYERAFTNLWGTTPNITVDNASANNFHRFPTYRKTEWKFSKCKEGKFSVNLMNAQADDSLVVSDTPIWVTNSSGTGFFVDWSRVFQSNSIVALSNAPAGGGAVEYGNGQDVTAVSGEIATDYFYNGSIAFERIRAGSVNGIILGKQADTVLLQEGTRDVLYAGSGLRHLKSDDGTSITMDFSNPTALFDYGVISTNNNIISPLLGTTAADAAPAGTYGQFLTNTVATGSAVSLTTATTANIASLSLSAGDWMVFGTVAFNPDTTTTTTYLKSGISTTSATLGGQGSFASLPVAIADNAEDAVVPTPFVHVNVSSTTTVYLVGRAAFAASTMAAYGQIIAWRVR